MAAKPHILFIDAYDSFANNIVSLLETTLSVTVRTVQIDNPILQSDDLFHVELQNYVAVVCGPGPGNPENKTDVGIMQNIWRLNDENILPVLGICLGFQSLCLEFGGKIKQLQNPQHGIPRKIIHTGIAGQHINKTIFDKVGIITATHYHSLCVDIGQEDGKYSTTTAWNAKKWAPFNSSLDLVPLAWVEDAKSPDRRVLMAASHRTKPFWGLQYHPESICTDDSSKMILHNWYQLAQEWNLRYRISAIVPDKFLASKNAVRKSLLTQFHDGTGPLPTGYTFKSTRTRTHPGVNVYFSRSIKIPSDVAVPDIIEAISDMSNDQILLDSSNSSDKSLNSVNVRGRYTIIGMDIQDSIRFEYFLATKQLNIHNLETRPGDSLTETINLEETKVGGVWGFLAKWMADRKIAVNSNRSPFLGGLMGYTTYEMGLESVAIAPKSGHQRQENTPDLCFAWVNRSIVIDHWENILYIQFLAEEEAAEAAEGWMDKILYQLSDIFLPPESFDPLVITMTRVPREVSLERIKAIFREDGRPEPQEISFDRCNMFGVVTARYRPEDKPWDFVEQLNGWSINLVPTRSRIMHSARIDPQPTSPGPLYQSDSPQGSFETISSNRLISVEKRISITTPNHQAYEDKVRQCQQYIKLGESYELCLTDQTTVSVPRTSTTFSSWERYKILRRRQPAPFASYVKLGSVTLISSSPERFLKWNQNGKCELRPMKGTVRKTSSVSTLSAAKKILHTPKERAELLMIIDLIRHDLHGICGSGNVSVSKIFHIEEYKSVFQMVAVIEGQIPPLFHVNSPSPQEPGVLNSRLFSYSGIDVLAASLPPGSMTGAPKKRSCEILQEMEGGKDRGLYSGVVGYIDVAGRGDWSVNIRCAYKYDAPVDPVSSVTWNETFEDLLKQAATANSDAISDSSSSEGSGTSTPVNKQRGDGDATGNTSNRSSMIIPSIIDTWQIGAGGAVTWLSTPEGEREEMLTKLRGTLAVFMD
jgi:para-aminobenzoate synthetase